MEEQLCRRQRERRLDDWQSQISWTLPPLKCGHHSWELHDSGDNKVLVVKLSLAACHHIILFVLCEFNGMSRRLDAGEKEEVWKSTEMALMLETGGQVQVLAGARRCRSRRRSRWPAPSLLLCQLTADPLVASHPTPPNVGHDGSHYLDLPAQTILLAVTRI